MTIIYMAPTIQRNVELEHKSQQSEPGILAIAAMHFFQNFSSGQGRGFRNPQIRCALDQFTRQHPSTFDGKLDALGVES